MGHKQEYVVVFRLLLLHFFLPSIRIFLAYHVNLKGMSSAAMSLCSTWHPHHPPSSCWHGLHGNPRLLHRQLAVQDGWSWLTEVIKDWGGLEERWETLPVSSQRQKWKNVINLRYSDYWSKSQEDSSSVCTLQLLVFPSPQASSMGGFTLLVDAWI